MLSPQGCCTGKQRSLYGLQLELGRIRSAACTADLPTQRSIEARFCIPLIHCAASEDGSIVGIVSFSFGSLRNLVEYMYISVRIDLYLSTCHYLSHFTHLTPFFKTITTMFIHYFTTALLIASSASAAAHSTPLLPSCPTNPLTTSQTTQPQPQRQQPSLPSALATR